MFITLHHITLHRARRGFLAFLLAACSGGGGSSGGGSGGIGKTVQRLLWTYQPGENQAYQNAKRDQIGPQLLGNEQNVRLEAADLGRGRRVRPHRYSPGSECRPASARPGCRSPVPTAARSPAL